VAGFEVIGDRMRILSWKWQFQDYAQIALPQCFKRMKAFHLLVLTEKTGHF
jgi:hypothetical protein